MERFLVLACFILIFLNNSLFVYCQSTQASDTTTGADVVTTDAATTDAQTTETTEQVTTQPPPTTTTPLPTLPPTVVASVTDIAPCPCDLTGNSCDVNCCCDLDCTNADRDVFEKCLETSGNVDDRMCVQENILLLENAPFPKNFTQDGLFCIYFDNYQERNFYSAPNLVTDTAVFNDYVNEYGSFSYMTEQTGQTSVAQYYKYGDPVQIVYQNLALGTLGLPRSLTSTGCSDSPVAYLKNEDSSCVRQITTLNQATCVGTSAFNAQSYYTGFRVVTSPYLFIYIVNGTAITTTPPTSTVTTTPAATPFQINLYNNSYTVDIGLSTVECRDSAGIQRPCNFPVGTVSAPTFTTGTCSNVVKEVEYVITHDGTNGISSVDVRFILQDINTASLPLTQTFKSAFSGVNDVNVTEYSGNPGYVVGKPVRAGIRYINESFGNRMVIVENGYDLSIVKSSADGTCLTDAGNRVQVNFGQELRSGCLIRFNLDTVTTAQYCTFMQQTINNALEGINDFINVDPQFNRYVATFGNSELEQTGDWVPILQFPARDTVTGSPLDGPSCQLSMGMHIQIVYAYVGSVANRQAKILGVAFRYEDQQPITYTCSGVACTPGNAAVDQSYEISQSVSFVDVSEPATGVVGDAPVFIAKVPNDFFYPFGTGSGNSLNYSILLHVFSVLLVYISSKLNEWL